MRRPIKFKKLHDLSSNNKEMLELSESGECVYCGSVHDYHEYSFTNDDSAICPNCGVDCVLPVYSDDLMNELRKSWFESTLTPDEIEDDMDDDEPTETSNW